MSEAALIQIIIAMIPVADKLIFSVGGKLIEIATTDMNTPESVNKALAAAREEGFPQLSFTALPEPVKPA